MAPSPFGVVYKSPRHRKSRIPAQPAWPFLYRYRFLSRTCFCAWELLLAVPGGLYRVLGTGLELPHDALCSCAAVNLPSLFCFKFL